jgi:hypothetical protein
MVGQELQKGKGRAMGPTRRQQALPVLQWVLQTEFSSSRCMGLPHQSD